MTEPFFYFFVDGSTCAYFTFFMDISIATNRMLHLPIRYTLSHSAPQYRINDVNLLLYIFMSQHI